jgi:hypothetical protein
MMEGLSANYLIFLALGFCRGLFYCLKTGLLLQFSAYEGKNESTQSF